MLIKEEKDRNEAKYKTAHVDDRIEQVCKSALSAVLAQQSSSVIAMHPNLWL